MIIPAFRRHRTMDAPPLSLAAIGQTAFLHDAGGRIAAVHDGAGSLAGRRGLPLNAHLAMAGGARRGLLLLPFEDVTGTAREAAS